MKKVFGLILAAAMAVPSFAEQKEPKDYSAYLPEAGDIAIGLNLNPVTDYLGQLFNNSVNGSIDNNAIGGSGLLWNNNVMTNEGYALPMVSIQGKYFLDDNIAVRANIGLVLNRQNRHEYVQDDAAVAADPLSQDKVEDAYHKSITGGSLSAGIEYRMGKNHRFQGVFSGNLLYSFYTQSQTWDYGNAITEINQAPSIDGTVNTMGYVAMGTNIPNARITKQSTDVNHTIGLVGTVGIEYFVAPKIALGAEIDLALLYSWKPAQDSKYEGFNTMNGSVDDYILKVSPKSSDFVFGTQNVGGNLYVMFYFN